MNIRLPNAKSAPPRNDSPGKGRLLCFGTFTSGKAPSLTPALSRWERVTRGTGFNSRSRHAPIQRWKNTNSTQTTEPRTIPSPLPAGEGQGEGERVARPAHSRPTSHQAFTLLEVLIALFILAMVMVVVHSVFYSAIQMRNKTDQAFSEAIPLQHTVALIKRDLANLTIPGGTFSGALQTTPTIGSTTSSMHYGQQAGPSFYTASGVVSDDTTWGDIQKVTYYLTPGTNNGNGLELVRSVTRNLLPVMQEEYTDQHLLSGVESLTFQFYNGTAWVDTWDSTATSTTSTTTNNLPQGIRAQLTMAAQAGQLAAPPIEVVMPVFVQPSTNTTSTTTSTTSGGST